MATLKDVARLANVDVSTVSRALNNSSYVHPDTKAKILAAVEKLSYSPNLLARGLRQGKRNTIGVVVPRLSLTAFAEVVQGIEEEARRHGYATLICHTEDNADIEKECLYRLRNGFIDGLIIAGTGQNTRLIRDIQSGGISCTQVIRQQDHMINSVTVDYRACSYEAVKYLTGRGCTKIGLINGSMCFAPYRERYEGYCKALAEFGLPEITVVSSRDLNVNSLEYGYNCTMELLELYPDLDAIMAAVDVQGIGAIRALKEKGCLRNKVRLISLTGHTIGGMLETAMTSMEMPAYEIGVKSARMTIEEIEKSEDKKSTPQHLVFNSSLTERETT